jgi:putative transposase
LNCHDGPHDLLPENWTSDTTDNASIESLSGKFRAESLNVNCFLSFDEPGRKCEAWRRDYNEVCLHSAIGIKVPAVLDRTAAHPGYGTARVSQNFQRKAGQGWGVTSKAPSR